MKLTKYGHACIVLEERDKKLVVDPGKYTPAYGGLNSIVAVVVTHVHSDHFFVGNLQKIIEANPGVKVFTTAQAAKEWGGPHAVAVKAGEEQKIQPFTLRFYGELHNAVHPDWPQDENVGVLVNDRFYYPGDSLTIPDRSVEVLAVPVGSSWLKLGEAMECIKTINPKKFIRTHDSLLNELGIRKTDEWLEKANEKFGPEYHSLSVGEYLEI